MNFRMILSASMAVCSLSTWGQVQSGDTILNRMVVVEQEYNPEITDAAKVNVVPAIPSLETTKKTVTYDWSILPAMRLVGETMDVYTVPEKQQKAAPGTVKLGYGSHGNVEALAAYRFHCSEKDQVNLHVGLTGQDGKRKFAEEQAGKWSSYFYRTEAAADWTHLFRRMTLDVSGNFGLSNFNFEPLFLPGKQKFTSGDFRVGIVSTDRDLPFQFKAATNLLIFQRQHDFRFDEAQENILRTTAEAIAPINEQQQVGLAIQLDNFFYQNVDFKNQTSLQLNPYFQWKNDDWNIHLGAHVDPASGFGKKFRAAPDVKIQCLLADSYVLYAQAQGGKQLNDFRRLESVSPYSLLGQQIDATYEQINGAVGFRGSPVAGWWFHLYAGYQDLKNDLIEGETWQGQDTHNFYAGLETRYAYKDRFWTKVKGVYRNWDASEGDDSEDADAALFFKTALEANLEVGFRPITPLQFHVGYQYMYRDKVAGEKLKDVSNLYAQGDYQIFPFMNIYARVANLLNQNFQYHWGCQALGINFIGGVSFRF